MEKEGKIFENRERPLAGKVALVTGSSRDIGGGIVKVLAEEGVNVIGNYRNKKKRADEVQQAILPLGVRSEFVQADITIEEGRNNLKQTLENSFGGKLDFLILNTAGRKEDEDFVAATNSLIDTFLPFMLKGSTIVFLQSHPGHFAPQLKDLNLGMDYYNPIAQTKYKVEQSLKLRMEEFKEKNVSFIIVCAPEVSDTSNINFFRKRFDSEISQRQTKISNMLGLPLATTIDLVGKKIAELLLKRKDLPMGYTELFGNTIDARNILSTWYGQEAIYVDTLEKIDEKSGTGRLIVTKEHAKGHFNDQVGISVLPGHKMIEASAQVLGLIALGGKITSDTMPLFQKVGSINFLKTVFPGDILQIQATMIGTSRRETKTSRQEFVGKFVGNANIFNRNQEAVAEIKGIEAVVMKFEVAKRLMGIKEIKTPAVL